MSKLDKNQRIRTSKPRQTFDLSHDYLFTATTGQLRAVSHDFLQPGDTVKGKFDFFLRTMPLSTAAMVDVDFMVDYFFVPMDLIWIRFGAWWSRTRSQFNATFDYQTSGYDTPLPDVNNLPKIEFVDLVNNVFTDVPSETYYQRFRLMDDLGLSGSWYKEDAGFVKTTIPAGGGPVEYGYPTFFPWQAAAYQAIYQHWYRDEEREEFDNTCYSLGIEGHLIDVPQLRKLFTMRYVNRMDDYFTSTKLSPLVSNINNDPAFLHDFNVSLGNNEFINDQLFQSPSYDTNSAPNNLLNHGGTGDYVSEPAESRAVNQLRALFAQEKLLHVMNMTHKDYDSQVLSRLGYNVPRDVKHGIQHLGHDTCQLNIQEIVSGSNTFDGSSGSSLGDLAGQGKAISKGFKGFKFTAPVHGVLMTIWTCRTRPKYTVSALRKDLISDITDFFTPELDDLGMQPQYRYETDLVRKPDLSNTLAVDPYIITGWNYRYEYLKRNVNRASLAFMRGEDGLAQVSPGTTWAYGYNTYSQWSSARVGLDKAYKVVSGNNRVEDDFYSRPHYDLYKVRPDELNNIMLSSWLGTPPTEQGTALENWLQCPWLAYQRDPFIVDGRFSCQKVSAMSLYSMPKLI